MEKRCKKCGEVKPLEVGFARNKATKDGRQSWCRKCHWLSQKNNPEYAAKHAAAHQRRWLSGHYRDRHLQKTFGISLEEYNKILDSQNGVCAICGKTQNNAKQKNLAVDHDHRTGRIRGLLCQNCNVAIGMLCDDHGLAEKAMAYLAANQSLTEPLDHG